MSVLDKVVDNNSGVLEDEDEANMVEVFKHYAAQAKDEEFRMDAATGYLFLSGLKAILNDLENLKNDKLLKKEERPALRVIMGPETDPRTKNFLKSIKTQSKDQLQSYSDKELQKVQNMIEEGLIEIRVFTKKKFHPKMYTFYTYENPHNPSAVWAGSANFSLPGLTENIELSIPFKSVSEETEKYEKWFQKLWEESSDNFDLLEVIEDVKTSRANGYEYLEPNYYFSKLLNVLDDKDYLFYSESSRNASLLNHQDFSYQRVMEGLNKYGGYLLANSVGTGKSFVASEAMRAYIKSSNKRCLLIHPSQVEQEWSGSQDKEGYLEKFGISESVDTLSMGMLEKPPKSDNPSRGFELGSYDKNYSLIVVDEAHHYRNNSNRRGNLVDLVKQNHESDVLLLTATPVNLSPKDFFQLIDIFYKGRNQAKFASAEIKDLYNSTKEKVKDLEGGEINPNVIKDVRSLRKALSVRVSWRIIQKEFEEDLKQIAGPEAKFEEPESEEIEYEYHQDYKDVLFENAKDESGKDIIDQDGNTVPKIHHFLKNLNYEPAKLWEDEYKEDKDLLFWYKWQLYKQLESSLNSFVINLDRMRKRYNIYLKSIEDEDLIESKGKSSEIVTDFSELINKEREERLRRLVKTYGSLEKEKQEKVLTGIKEDISAIDDMISNIKEAGDIENIQDAPYANDNKLSELKSQLNGITNDGKKALIFSEWVHTVEYIYSSLKPKYGDRIAYIHGSSDKSKEEVQRKMNNGEIDILITSDVLREGVNLPGADVVINYDLPYNPVALIQRTGRALRINNPKKIEVKNFKASENINNELNLFKTLGKRFDGMMKTVGMDFVVWSLKEDKIKDFKDREWEAHKEAYKEYRNSMARDNPGSLAPNQLNEGDSFNLFLKDAIERYNITLEDCKKTSKNVSLPFYTVLKGDYDLKPVFKIGQSYKTPEIKRQTIERGKKGLNKEDKATLERIKNNTSKQVRLDSLSSSGTGLKDQTLIKKLRNIRTRFGPEKKEAINTVIRKIKQNGVTSSDKQKINKMIDEVDEIGSYVSKVDKFADEEDWWTEFADISSNISTARNVDLISLIKFD